MLHLRRLLLALVLSSVAVSAHAQVGYSRAAQRVIARAFAATGGHGWYQLRGWHETGREGDTAYETWIDPLRYGQRLELRAENGSRIRGFNGQAVWQVTPAGEITAVNDHPTLAEARTRAFFAAYCFFYPGRFDARGDYVGVRTARGRAYEVVRVQPGGGYPRELWFDQRTHLLARIVDRTGRRARAIAVSDYRRIGPVLVAFRFSPEPGGAPELQERRLQSLAFTPASRDIFSLDRPQDTARAQVRLAP